MQQISLSFRGPHHPVPRARRHWHQMTREEQHRETIRLVCAPTRVRKVPVSLPLLKFMSKEID